MRFCIFYVVKNLSLHKREENALVAFLKRIVGALGAQYLARPCMAFALVLHSSFWFLAFFFSLGCGWRPSPLSMTEEELNKGAPDPHGRSLKKSSRRCIFFETHKKVGRASLTFKDKDVWHQFWGVDSHVKALDPKTYLVKRGGTYSVYDHLHMHFWWPYFLQNWGCEFIKCSHWKLF